MTAKWDAGDLSCGEIIIALRSQIQSVPPGALLEVTARDLGAPADMPSWCRLTGHELVTAEHPVYLIRRRTER